MNKYCVYRHIRLDKNTPFHVGMGSLRRPHDKSSRNKKWKAIVNKHNYRVEIVYKNLTLEEAHQKERLLIKLYKSFNYCETNFREGGEGGGKPTQETINKLKQYKGKNHHYFGKKRPDHSKSMRGSNNPRFGLKGKNNPQFKGYWYTPKGRFESSRLAGEANNCLGSVIVRRAKNPNMPEWYFIPKNKVIS